MAPDEDVTRADVAVVGAGMAGLAAAATAARAGRRVVIVDHRSPGGRARCDEVDGFTFNQGPRALYRSGAGRRVLDDLGVDWDTGGQPVLRGAMGRRDGRLHLLPQGPGSLLRTGLLGAADKVRVARLLGGIGRADQVSRAEGKTVREWVADVAPSPAVAELLHTLVRLTTYTDAPDVLDAAAAVANVQSGLDPGVSYIDGGWQSLVDGLLAAVTESGGQVLARRVDQVTSGETGATISTPDGHLSAASVVVAAGGPEAAARLLGRRPEGWDSIGPPATAACLELGLRRPPPTRVVLGLDEPLYLSTHCPPARLAPDGGAVVHAIRYQSDGEEVSPDEQRAHLRAVVRQAGIGDDDVVTERFLARMVVATAIPTAAGGGLAGRPGTQVPGLPATFVAGDWVGPEGLLADAALASGADAGRRAAAMAATLTAA